MYKIIFGGNMLIQITNHCTMNCPHCMQDSKENGHHMTEEVFLKTLEFGEWSGCYTYNISGGEPTEHPYFEHFMEILTNHLEKATTLMAGAPVFTIESNGEWARDVSKTAIVKKILKSKKLAGFQVSSFKGLYRNYDFIQKYKKRIEALHPKMIVEDTNILSMQPLGRASYSQNPTIIKAIAENKHHVSCLNGCLISKQTDSIKEMNTILLQAHQFCKPFVDWEGNVHWSESVCCPSYGNVLNDNFEKIWENLRKAKPCGKCKLYENLQNSTDPRIILARKIMGL